MQKKLLAPAYNFPRGAIIGQKLVGSVYATHIPIVMCHASRFLLDSITSSHINHWVFVLCAIH